MSAHPSPPFPRPSSPPPALPTYRRAWHATAFSTLPPQGIKAAELVELCKPFEGQVLPGQTIEMLQICPAATPCLRVGCIANFMQAPARPAHPHARTVVILRGLPGSGKSVVGRQLAAAAPEGKQCVVCGADFYFTTPSGEYNFDATQLPQAHAQSLLKFVAALQVCTIAFSLIIVRSTRLTCRGATRVLMPAQGGAPLVIVDNVHSQLWEYEPYVSLAERFAYAVEVKEIVCAG